MKTKVLFVTSCLLVLAACSKDAGSKKGTPWDDSKGIPVDGKLTGTDLQNQFLSVPAWCSRYENSELKTQEIGRAVFKNDGTLESTTHEVNQDGSRGKVKDTNKLTWKVENDRLTTVFTIGEQKMESNSAITFKKSGDDRICFETSDFMVDGKPYEIPADRKDSFVSCSCN